MRTGFVLACMSNELPTAQWLHALFVAASTSLAKVERQHAFSEAAELASVEVMQWLYSQGVDVNAVMPASTPKASVNAVRALSTCEPLGTL